ncbi:hypothetical protein Holit_00611 [Hollandina sp. SP2]
MDQDAESLLRFLFRVRNPGLVRESGWFSNQSLKNADFLINARFLLFLSGCLQTFGSTEPAVAEYLCYAVMHP